MDFAVGRQFELSSACTGRTRLRAVLIGFLAALGLVAWGSGANAGTSKINLIITSDSPQTQLIGKFRAIDGYLARSPRVLRSVAPSGQVRFAPKLPKFGHYQLFAWWPQGVRGAGAIRATISDANGTTTVPADQSKQGGQWNYIGVFQNAPSRSIAISLTGDGSSNVIADAVRLFYLGSEMPAIDIQPESVPPAEAHSIYEVEFSATGRPPFSWTVLSGQLPEGLEFNASMGTISGMAAKSGRSEFLLEVQDATGRRASRPMSIEVLKSETEE